MTRRLTVLCAAKLHRNQLERHLELLEHIPEVERVLVVRRESLSSRLTKVENIGFLPGSRGIEMARFGATISRVLKQYEVNWVLGFNPVHWGSTAFALAQSHQVKTSLSLIGMDFKQLQRWWGLPFMQATKAADAVTVTGETMRERMIELGVNADRLHVLPHSVDVQRFSPEREVQRWDLVAVGQLVARKRMDVIIDAVAILRSRGKDVRVGILGKGRLEAQLRARAHEHGVSDLVEFLGYRDDVEQVLKSARVFCLMSEWEGVPFALMEAMAAGLVPIMTQVGTIGDWVRHGENGLLVEVGKPEQLAASLERALGADGERMREQLLAERARLSFGPGIQVWRGIFGLPADEL